MTTPHQPDAQRRLTIVVPMRNEEGHIRACLDSILANARAERTIEVLVLDGDSTDASPAIVAEMADRDPRIRLIRNERRLQAAAFNLGLAEARGEFLIRVDAHSLLPPDYLDACLAALEETGADNVGGPIVSHGEGLVSGAIAAAYRSRFCLGHNRHDPSLGRREVDSVSFGAFRVEALRRIGGMDPSFSINEDFELNHRLRQEGGKVVWDPRIRAHYLVRNSLGRLTRQYFRYGFWKVRTLLHHPDSVRARQLVAPAFVVALLLTPFLIHWFGPIGAVHLAAYAGASLAASVITAARSDWRQCLILPLIFLLIHLAWGTGFLLGLGYWPFRERRTTPR